MSTENKLNHCDKNFKKYEAVFKSGAIDFKGENSSREEIVNREFVISACSSNAKIIFCGINPSFRKKDLTTDERKAFPFHFNHEGIKNDPYYRKFHNFKTKINPENKYCESNFDYLDLLVQRHTEQKEIFGFLDDEKGAIFIANQLAITQSFIEEVKPKCILVFNKFAANFFGKNAKQNRRGEWINVWMGYEFKPIDGVKDVFKITGLLKADGRINPHLKETNLIGTIVYFSRHLGRYTAKKYMEEVEKDLEFIGKELV